MYYGTYGCVWILDSIGPISAISQILLEATSLSTHCYPATHSMLLIFTGTGRWGSP